MRICLALVACGCVLLGAPAAHAALQAGRVIVVAVDQATIADWRGDPTLAPILRSGSVALLSTRAGPAGETRAERDAAAFATIGSGAQRADGRTGTELAAALAAAGVPSFVAPELRPVIGGSLLPQPARAVTHGLIVVRARSSGDVAVWRDALRPSDLLVVLSPVPADSRRGISLGMAAFIGSDVPRGLAFSPSTRRAGVVALTDVAPTIARRFGVDPTSTMEGRGIGFRSAADASGVIEDLEGDVVAAHTLRRPLTRGAFAFAIAAVALAVILTFTEPAVRAGRSIVPRGLRDWSTTLLVAAAAAPIAVYATAAYGTRTLAPAAVAAASVCAVLAIGGRAIAGREGALLAVAALTAIVPLADLVAGSPLASRSPMTHYIDSGGRFYGVDDVTLGIVLGAALVAVALVLDRWGSSAVVTGALWIGVAAMVWLLGDASFGAKFGSAPTAVPAFGVLAWKATGRRLGWRALVTIGVASVAVTAALVLADTLRSAGEQSHVARAVEGTTDTGNIVSRKIQATWRVTIYTIWSRATLFFGGALALVVWRRREAFELAFQRRPWLRAALSAAAVAIVAGVLFNDGGVKTALPVALSAVSAALIVMLAPDDARLGPRSDSPRPDLQPARSA